MKLFSLGSTSFNCNFRPVDERDCLKYHQLWQQSTDFVTWMQNNYNALVVGGFGVLHNVYNSRLLRDTAKRYNANPQWADQLARCYSCYLVNRKIHSNDSYTVAACNYSLWLFEASRVSLTDDWQVARFANGFQLVVSSTVDNYRVGLLLDREDNVFAIVNEGQRLSLDLVDVVQISSDPLTSCIYYNFETAGLKQNSLTPIGIIVWLLIAVAGICFSTACSTPFSMYLSIAILAVPAFAFLAVHYARAADGTLRFADYRCDPDCLVKMYRK